MAVDRELGAGSWSYFGDPRAISHAGDTFTGWISTTGNVWVARYTADGKLTKRRDLQGPRTRRPQQPVARLPPRRAHHGLLLAALRAPPAAARASQGDALHGLAEPVLDRRLRAGPHRRHQRARRPGLHLPQPDAAPGQAVALLARRRAGTRPSPTPTDGIHWVPARELVYFGHAAAAVREVRRRRQAPDPRHLHRRPPGELEEQPALPRYENEALYAVDGRSSGR